MEVWRKPLSLTGVGLGLLTLLVSMTPSLLPRVWVVQGAISGVSSCAGYTLGVLLAWVAGHVRLRSPQPPTRRRVWYGIATVAVVTIPVALWLGGNWQDEVRRAVGDYSEGPYLYAGIVVVAAAVLLVVLGIVRAIRSAYRSVVRRLGVPVRASRLVVAGLLAALIASVLTGLLGDAIVAIADAGYTSLDSGTDAGVVQPASPLRSGSRASLVAWSTLGIRGRAFVAAGPSPAAIERLTHRPATEPIRVYAGTDSAASFASEAALVLAELRRTGAFDRALLAVGTPPGEGGLDESLTAPLEYMYGGDTAIAAMQYSHLPSWVSFLLDETRARESSRILFDTVYTYWSRLAAAHRPRLVVFGMSLGALGSADMFSGLDDLTRRTSGALFVGPPSDTALWQQLTAQRAAGTPERLPVYGDGRTVRFAASSNDLRATDGSLLAPRVVFLQHASDPIVWWSPRVVWRPAGWLNEPRGRGVTDAVRWFPFVTFAQLTGDLRVGGNVPAGYGHHYGAREVVTAWAAILHPQGWTEADTSALVSAAG